MLDFIGLVSQMVLTAYFTTWDADEFSEEYSWRALRDFIAADRACLRLQADREEPDLLWVFVAQVIFWLFAAWDVLTGPNDYE